MAGKDRPDKGTPPDWTESDKAELDRLLEDRKWEARMKQRRTERRESVKSWALWITALAGAFTVVKDGARALWGAIAPLIGRGP